MDREHRGYITLATNDEEYRQATALAYSIKIHNKNAKVAIIADYIDRIPHHYHHVFDYMIDMPFSKNDITRLNDWQLYWSTPFVHNIFIDCASLVKENHDQAWEYLEDHYDLCFNTQSLSFKGELLDNKKMISYYNDYFLDKPNTSMFYFKHDTDLALSFFKLADPLMQNWRETFSNKLAKKDIPTYYDAEIMYALILQSIEFDYTPLQNKNLLTVVDMKTTLYDRVIGNDWKKWTDRLNCWISAGTKIKIQNFAISNTLYYYENEFLTEEIFDEHRDYYRAIYKEL